MMTKTEKINLAATILGPVVVSGMVWWVGWSIDAKFTISMEQQKAAVAKDYVTKESFKDYSDKQDRFAQEMRNNFSTLQSQVVDVAKDVATVKGQLEVQKK